MSALIRNRDHGHAWFVNLRWLARLCAFAILTAVATAFAGAQADAPSQALDLAIIVVPTKADAEAVST